MFNLNFSFRRLRVLAAGAVLFSLCSVRINAASLDYEQPFKLTPLNDGIQLGLGVALSGSALVCDKILNMKESEFNPADLHQEDIPLMEQMFMNPYSKPLHIVGTATLGVALVSPAIFAILPSSEWLTVGTMYAETVLIANGIKEWGKLLVNRARPYMYYDGYPQDKVEDGDWNCSFPSGHTTMAFAGAAFTTMVYCRYFPDSKWNYAVAGVSFGFAALTGCLRMASGNHFFTDVLTGALIGTICGFAVPYYHTKNIGTANIGKAKASVSPVGFNMKIEF